MSLKRKRVTDQVLEQAFNLVKKGDFLKDVAKEIGVPITYLSTKLTQKYGAKYTQLTRGNLKRGFMRYARNKARERKQRYLELGNRIRQLYWEQKKSLDEVGASLGLAATTIHKIMVGEGIPRKKASWRNIKQIKPQKTFLTIEKAKLIAMLLTDGTEYKRSHRVIFINKDYTLRNEFMRLIHLIYGDIGFYLSRMEISINSLQLIEDIHKYTPTLKKKRKGKETNACIPASIINGSHQMITAFLRYAVSCDGYVTISPYGKKDGKWHVQRRVGLKCKHRRLRKQYGSLLRKLHIGFLESSFGLQIRRRPEITKFANAIDFVDGVRIHGDSKYWTDEEKNTVLKLALKYPPRCSFNSKEECLTSLRACLSKIKNRKGEGYEREE